MMKLVYLILFLVFSGAAKAEDPCFYPSKKDDGELSLFDDCGHLQGDALKLTNKHRENLLYDEHGHACVIFSVKDAFYMERDGRSHRVLFFDNGCDHFENGLARGIINGQMVFINKQLEVALDPGFDLLFHYDYDHSIVCNGPFVEAQQGEHLLLSGGNCGLMNKHGDLVVDAIYRMEEREVFMNYLNNNSHCPPPPVTSEDAALCHAKRHVANMDHLTAPWRTYEISTIGELWLISFIAEGENSAEFTLTLDASSAHWASLLKEPHQLAVQRLSQRAHF